MNRSILVSFRPHLEGLEERVLPSGLTSVPQVVQAVLTQEVAIAHQIQLNVQNLALNVEKSILPTAMLALSTPPLAQQAATPSTSPMQSLPTGLPGLFADLFNLAQSPLPKGPVSPPSPSQDLKETLMENVEAEVLFADAGDMLHDAFSFFDRFI
jgi:hypothetical protein